MWPPMALSAQSPPKASDFKRLVRSVTDSKRMDVALVFTADVKNCQNFESSCTASVMAR